MCDQMCDQMCDVRKTAGENLTQSRLTKTFCVKAPPTSHSLAQPTDDQTLRHCCGAASDVCQPFPSHPLNPYKHNPHPHVGYSFPPPPHPHVTFPPYPSPPTHPPRVRAAATRSPYWWVPPPRSALLQPLAPGGTNCPCYSRPGRHGSCLQGGQGYVCVCGGGVRACAPPRPPASSLLRGKQQVVGKARAVGSGITSNVGGQHSCVLPPHCPGR